MNYYVYRHIRLDKNVPFYIGIGKKRSTFRTHNQEYKRAFTRTPNSRNNIWYNITNKTDYRVEILLDNLTKEEAIKSEIELILLYGKIRDKTGTLANITNGGESKEGVRRKPMSLEHKAILSNMMKLNNPNKDGRLLPFQFEGVRERVIERMKSFANPAFLKCKVFEVVYNDKKEYVLGVPQLYNLLQHEYSLSKFDRVLKKYNYNYKYNQFEIKLVENFNRLALSDKECQKIEEDE